MAESREVEKESREVIVFDVTNNKLLKIPFSQIKNSQSKTHSPKCTVLLTIPALGEFQELMVPRFSCFDLYADNPQDDRTKNTLQIITRGMQLTTHPSLAAFRLWPMAMAHGYGAWL